MASPVAGKIRKWLRGGHEQPGDSGFREIPPTVINRTRPGSATRLRGVVLSSDGPRAASPTANQTTRAINRQPPSRLMCLPRELRDIILAYVIQDEEAPYSLNTKTDQQCGHFIRFKNKQALISHQLCSEYRELLDKTAAMPIEYELQGFREPRNAIDATVNNVNFEGVMAYIMSLSEERRRSFSDPSKLRISLVFTSLYETRRVNLMKWLEFCEKLGVSPRYRAPHFTGRDHNPVLYVNIYDLFGREGGPEEERIFSTLQRWYCGRRSNLVIDGRVMRSFYNHENDKHGPYLTETRRAKEKGLRQAKTAEQNLQPVRLAED